MISSKGKIAFTLSDGENESTYLSDLHNQIMPSIEKLKSRLKQAITIDKFGEGDTIERFVIPIISLAGWDVDSLTPMVLVRGNRDNRSSKRQFDIALYMPQQTSPRVVFECKSLSQEIILTDRGSSNNSNQCDFVRQIRNDCLSGKFNFKTNYTTPVLTNGRQWVLFKNAFLQESRKGENINNENFDDFILSTEALESDKFLEKIIIVLRRCTE